MPFGKKPDPKEQVRRPCNYIEEPRIIYRYFTFWLYHDSTQVREWRSKIRKEQRVIDRQIRGEFQPSPVSTVWVTSNTRNNLSGI